MAIRIVGRCIGGPMDGMWGQSRYPEGFLLVDGDESNPSQQVCVYDHVPGGEPTFVARPKENLDYLKLNATADEPRYDIRAYDPELMGAW